MSETGSTRSCPRKNHRQSAAARDESLGATETTPDLHNLNLPSIRRHALERMLLSLELLGGVAITIVVGLDLSKGNYLPAAVYSTFYILLVTTMVLKRIPYYIRCNFALFLLYILGTYEMYNWGIGSVGPVIYFSISLFASILLGTRAASAAIAISIFSLIALAFYHAALQPEEDLRSTGDYIVAIWLPDIINLTVFSTMAVAFLAPLLEGLSKSVDVTQQFVEELRLERNELRQTIDERNQVEHQLRQAQKMQAVGQLAGGVAHDFNNLLQAILGYCAIAKTKVDEDSTVHDDIEQVLIAGERARVLVRQLLAFSRQQVLEISNLDVNIVTEELIHMIRRVIGEHIHLNFHPGEVPGIVRADRGQIEQVLINLCVNARDAMDDTGTLTIETGTREFDSAYCEAHVWAKTGTYRYILVSDTGRGIDQEAQQRIFEPFYTTKELGKGTGLGLSTVFGIIRQHNGMVNLHSEVGLGTTFEIYLPAAPDADIQMPEPVIAHVETGTETILVADDDRMVLDVARLMLNRSGYTVLTAEDGEEAIRIFDAHADEIDLALLDVVMPKLGGRAVYDHIVERFPDTPILFSSGYSSDSIHTNFVLDAGMQLIQKLYHREELLLKIQDLFSSRAERATES